METEDRERLRKHVESGDEVAFGSLVRKYLGLVFVLSQRRTGDHELAEEIAQTVFAKLAAKAAIVKEGAFIVFAKDVKRGWGNVVISGHRYADADGPIRTVDVKYGHLDGVDVKEGNQVKRSTKLT